MDSMGKSIPDTGAVNGATKTATNVLVDNLLAHRALREEIKATINKYARNGHVVENIIGAQIASFSDTYMNLMMHKVVGEVRSKGGTITPEVFFPSAHALMQCASSALFSRITQWCEANGIDGPSDFVVEDARL
jgi:hypothetical protein